MAVTGGLLDYNPFLLPLLLVVFLVAVYGPLRTTVLAALPRGLSVTTGCLARLQHHLSSSGWTGAGASPTKKKVVVGALLFVVAGFVVFEVYFQRYNCRVSER